MSETRPPLDTALRHGSGRDVRTLWLDAPGARLHAWLITPRRAPPWPLVVMAHGWAAVKEMNLDYFAAAMCDAGLAALVFDHRGFGASEGPRGDIAPHRQIDDFAFALSVAERMDGVDPDRLGVWGTSFSGGHVLCLAQRDARVRAVVSQVPTISGSVVARRRRGADGMKKLAEQAERERANLNAGRPPHYVPAADVGGHDIPGATDAARADPVPPQELPPAPTTPYDDEQRWRFYLDLPEARRRTWRNQITLLSAERYAAYEPGRSLLTLTTPLLVIYADADTITPTDLIREAIARSPATIAALEVPGGHYSVYTAHREHTARAAARVSRGAASVGGRGQVGAGADWPTATATARSSASRGSSTAVAAR